MMLLRPPPPRTRLERLAQQRFGLGLHLPEQDETIFVEFFAAGLGLDGGDAVLDFAEVDDYFADAQGAGLVDYARLVVNEPEVVVGRYGCVLRRHFGFDV